MDLAEQVRRLKLWYHRGEAHGLTVEQVDAVFDAAARAQPEASLTKEAARYRHITAHVIDWDEGDTKKWMISDQFYTGPTLGEAIDAAIESERKPQHGSG